MKAEPSCLIPPKLIVSLELLIAILSSCLFTNITRYATQPMISDGSREGSLGQMPPTNICGVPLIYMRPFQVPIYVEADL